MPTTPYTDLEDTTLNIHLSLDGSDMSEEYGIKSIEISHGINKISYAEITLTIDVKDSIDKINNTDLDVFNPGTKIEILAGYGRKSPVSLFKGIIVKHTLALDIESHYTVRLVCKNPAVKMTYNERDRCFLNKTDDAIMNAIIGEYGLTCSIASTNEEHENMFQKMCTDWDFILSRSEFNGFIITMDKEDGVTIKAPEISGRSVIQVEVGIDIMSFDGTLDAEYQPSAVSVSAWDAKTLSLISSTAAEPAMNTQGDIAARSLSSKLAQTELNIISTTPMTSNELRIWADSILLRKRLHAFRGKVKFIGNATVKTGDIITIVGVGTKLSGDAFVSAVLHTIDSDGWRTTTSFGLENNRVGQSHRFSYPAATGQLPAIQGIHMGTVKKLANDPAGNYRVQVELPSNSETATSLWARMSNFYATNKAGLFFLPEVGDEVVLGFMDNDPRYPVILGSLYNGKNSPPYTADPKNNIKAIVTNSRMKIEFDERKKSITLETPGKNTIVISDDGKSIEIKDQNQNSIRLGSNGIALESSKDINISAKGNIKIDALSKVNIAAKTDIAISGLNVTAPANVGFTAKGNATAELSASGETTVKGGMVRIN